MSSFLLSRRSLVAGGSVFAALAATGSVPAFADNATPSAAGEPKLGGTLKLGMQGDPVGLDPHISILDAADIVFDFVYEGLVRLDPMLEPIPSLAVSWVLSDDGLTYTFALRSGVTFHNGRALDSSDIQYSIQRVMDPATASPDVTHTEGIANLEAPDSGTVVITLKAPDASFLTRLARPGLSAVPKEVVEVNGDLQQVMVGTGPFIFEEYIPNTSLSFTKNQAYWDTGKPYIDQLELLIIPNDTSRTTALVTGTVDMIEAVPHKDVEAVKGDSALKLAGDRVTNLRWIAFNLEREPFNNLEFRKAVGLGLDRQPIIDTAVFGFGEPLLGMYPVEFWAGYQGAIPDADPEAARAALASMTLPEGFRPKLLTWAAYQFLSSTSIVVQEQLKNIGIESDIDPQENATYIDNFFGGNFDIAVMGAAGYSDPDEFLRSILGSGEVTNASRYSNEEFDALLDEGLATQDRSARADIYQLAQQIAINDAPIIPLYTSNTYEGMAVEIEGFEHSLSGRLGSIRSTWINK